MNPAWEHGVPCTDYGPPDGTVPPSYLSWPQCSTVTYQLTNIIHNGLVRKRFNLGSFVGHGKRCQSGNSPIWEIIWEREIEDQF